MSLPFAFVDDGDTDAQPVVFLHAFPYHSGMWEPQRAALRGRARFLAFDARGVGMRKAETTAYMLEHTVDDLLALLAHLGLEKVLLCGLSMGGYAALRAVARAPQRVSGLLLSNTQAAADSDTAKLGRAEGVRALARDGVQNFTEQQIKRQLSPRSQATRPDLAQRLLELTAGASEAGVAASLVAIATRSDQSAALAAIRVPTTLIAGADDVVTPPALAQFMAAQIPQAKLHVLEGVGHLASLEAEDAFNRLVLEHLDRVR